MLKFVPIALVLVLLALLAFFAWSTGEVFQCLTVALFVTLIGERLGAFDVSPWR